MQLEDTMSPLREAKLRAEQEVKTLKAELLSEKSRMDSSRHTSLDTINSFKASNQKLRTELQDLRDKLEELIKNRRLVRTELSSTKHESEALRTKLHKLETQRDRDAETISELEHEVEALKSENCSLKANAVTHGKTVEAFTALELKYKKLVEQRRYPSKQKNVPAQPTNSSPPPLPTKPLHAPKESSPSFSVKTSLLQEIREGDTKLKHVTPDMKNVRADDSSMLNVIARALVQRRKHLREDLPLHTDREECDDEDWQ